jgi:hypothetical protein
MLAFSFSLHSCFIRITDPMSLKYSSPSFSTASYLIFYALIHWILLLWLGVRPRGHQRGARTVPGAVVFEVFFCPESRETGWPGLGNWTVQFGNCRELVPGSILVSTFTSGTLSCSAATSSGLFSRSGVASPLVEDLHLSPVLP